MIKLFALIPKRPDITLEAFHEHWRTTHKDHALSMRNLQRYVQNHRVEPSPSGFPPKPLEGFDAAPYPGIAEAWFSDLATAAGMGEDPDYVNGALQDEPNFMDMPRLAFLITQEQVLLPGPAIAQDTELTKALLLLRRAPGTSPQAFRDHWSAAHAALATQVPGLVRYVQSSCLPDTYGEQEPVFDGVAEMWWQDEDARAEALASSQMEDVLDDLAGFTGPGSAAVPVQELRFIWS